MSQRAWDDMGNMYVVDDNGNAQMYNEAGVLAHTGRQFADMYDNLRLFTASDEQTRNQIRRDLAERERLFAPAEEVEPVAAFVGSALPGMATAPLSASGMLGGFALNAGLGAAEGALSYDPNASAGQRALAGAASGALGDWAGRIVGRVFNGARGLADDVAFSRAQRAGISPEGIPEDVARWEALGGRVPGYQYLEEGTKPRRLAERAAQYNEASVNPDPYIRQVTDHNDRLMTQAASEAVGVPTDGALDSGWRRAVLDAHSEGFANMAARAADADGVIEVGGPLLKKLRNNRVLKQLREDYDMFQGLDADDAFLSPTEYMEARMAIAGMAADESNASLAKAHWSLVDELDNFMETRLATDPTFVRDYATLREQHRVFLQLEKPNVIDARGEINMGALDRQLKRPSGFGRQATAPGGTNVPKNLSTERLIELADAGNQTAFKAFKSSGTAENLAGRTFVEDVADATVEAATGNMRPGLSLAIQANAPGAIGRANRGRGAMFEGAYTPAGTGFLRAGGGIGRSMLDEQLYPFVGVRDDREQ